MVPTKTSTTLRTSLSERKVAVPQTIGAPGMNWERVYKRRCLTLSIGKLMAATLSRVSCYFIR